MPKILEMKEIDGEVWVRVGKPPDFPSGVALWTPDEQSRLKRLSWNDAIEAAAEWLANEDIENDPDDLYTGRTHRVAAIRKLKKP